MFQILAVAVAVAAFLFYLFFIAESKTGLL
jgi:hypothetical protein